MAITLCVLLSAIFIILMPDIIPAHYNFAGEVDRFGSKYEMLIMTGITVLTAAGLLLSAYTSERKGKTENLKVLLIITLLTTLFLMGMSVFFFVKALTYEEGAPTGVSMEIMKFVSMMTGICLVVYGNILPKLRRNSRAGMRTKWSLSSDVAWQKSQRLAGIAGVICGLILMFGAIFISGIGNIIFMTVVSVVWIVLSVVASYRYAKG